MTVLSIDTSIPTLRVGVSKEKTLVISALEPPVTHAEAILPAVEQVLQKAAITINNIELLAIAGAASFTGLRIGIATAKGLSLGLGIPMVLVPTWIYMDGLGENSKALSCLSSMHESIESIVLAILSVKE